MYLFCSFQATVLCPQRHSLITAELCCKTDSTRHLTLAATEATHFINICKTSYVCTVKLDEESLLPPSSFHYASLMFTLRSRKSPLHSVIIHIRLSGWELFTFLIDSLIEVKLRRNFCRIIQICEGKNGNAKRQSQTAANGSALPLQHHRDINLAKDKATGEVVTAQSWIPSPQCQNLPEYILS